MSRPLRIEYKDAWYHVMNRGRRHEDIYTCKQDRDNFVKLLQETIDMWSLRVSAYCLMHNHYHLLVQTPEGNLSRCMRHIDGVYTQRFNRFHGHDGQLFRGRYKSILVDANTYILYLLRYIHRNPVRARLVKTPGEYKWSSYRGYVSTAEKWSWLHKQVVLQKFSNLRSERLKRFKSFMMEKDKAELLKILESTRWPSILGSKSFVERIKERFFGEFNEEEIPESKTITPDMEKIIQVVSEYYSSSKQELMQSRRGVCNEPRNMAIYLTRQLRFDSLVEIGKFFHMEKYSSVSTVIERMEQRIKKNSAIRKKANKLIYLLTKSQEQT